MNTTGIGELTLWLVIFVVGFIAGGLLGIFVAGLMAMAKRGEDVEN